MDEITTHTSDVLVIGGGGAALIAACAAVDAGMSVNLVSKKPPGLASCTAYAGGGFTAALEGVSADQHRQMTVRTGCGINNPELVDVLSAEGASALNRLRSWGVNLRFRHGGASVRSEQGNPLTGGTGLTLPLLRHCREIGVTMHHPVRVERLLQEEFAGPVHGAEGPGRDGSRIRFLARSTIMATGGAGWLYSRTDNPSGTTGDGYLLSLCAGAVLRDMEFVQFYPLGSGPGSGTTWFIGANILDHARLVDGAGEEFLPALFREWGISSGREANLLERDRLSRAIALRRRNTGSVTLHLEDIPPSLREDRYLAHVARLLGGRHEDPWRPVEVAPIQHFMSGGVVIDSHGATAVPGLYACGEVTGGVHGANRVGGNALTELAVFGIRAGEAAAPAAGHGSERPPASGFIRPGRITFDKVRDEGDPYPSLRELRDLVGEHLGPLRDGCGLTLALARLGSGTRNEDGRSFEHHALTAAASMIALAALTREESRGCHYRSDFPSEGGERTVVLLRAEPFADGPAPDLHVSVSRQSLEAEG